MNQSGRYTIKAGEGLELRHFLQMEKLEASFYSQDFITPACEAHRWYTQHPRTTVAAFDGKQLVGFVNVLPVEADLFDLILCGEFNDATLTADDIPAFDALKAEGSKDGALTAEMPKAQMPKAEMPKAETPKAETLVSAVDETAAERMGDASFGLFLSCIAVEKPHHGTGLAQTLLYEALKLYIPPAQAETRVITDNVTSEGSRFSEKLGFEFVRMSDHESQIYVTTVGRLVSHLEKSGLKTYAS